MLPPQTQVIDLAQPYFPGMPHWPTHPPFAIARTKEHGDYVLPGGVSAAAELITLGTHVGTHIDGLGHFSCNGFHYGNRTLEEHGIDLVAPICRRAIFFNMASHGPLPADAAIDIADLKSAARADIRPGDVILIRTGWDNLWQTPRLFINEQRQPGLTLDAARWLSAQSVYAIGADNVALERIPSPRMEVHVHLLVEQGIHIIECLNLAPLAEASPTEFTIIAAPLKIKGATGAPIRPLALL